MKDQPKRRTKPLEEATVSNRSEGVVIVDQSKREEFFA